MKKMFALLAALVLAAGAAAFPAAAEESGETVDQVTSATVRSGKGNNRRQAPGGNQDGQASGQDNPNGQASGQSGTEGQNSQAPRLPGTGTQNGRNGRQKQAAGSGGQNGPVPGSDNQNGRQNRTPGNGGRKNRQGSGSGNHAGTSGTLIDFDALLKEGVITSEVYDAIMAYMNGNAGQPQEGGAAPELPDGTELPAVPDGAKIPAVPDGAELPALPDGLREESAGAEEQLLKELLDNGVITQDQYDLLVRRITPAGTEASAV